MKKIILFIGLCVITLGLSAQSTFRTGIRVADSFLPTTNGGVAIGSTTRQFSGEFLFTGGAINWDNGDITITHSANTITLGGGDLALGGNNLTMTGSLAATANRVLKGWFTNLEITNLPTVNGGTLKAALSLTSTDVGLGNVTNKIQVEREDSALMAGGYTSYADGLVTSSGLAAKLNKADSALMAGGYFSYSDGIAGLALKLNKADSALMAGGYFSYSDGIAGLALKLNKADSALMAGGYFSYSDGLLKANTASPTFTGTVVINTAINPDADGGAEMGTNALRFNHIYGDSIHANWFGNSDFKLGAANDKLTFNGDTLTATSANFRSLESYVNRFRVGASAGSFLLDSITKSGTTIKFYDGATELEPNISIDTVALETIVQLLSDSAVVIPFLMGSGQAGDTALFNDGAICGSFYNYKDTLVAVYFNGVMSAGTGTETMTIDIKWHATFQDGSAVELNSTPLTVTSLTTGTTDASFNNSIIPPGVRVWGIVAGISAGNRPSYFEGSLVCYRQNRRY